MMMMMAMLWTGKKRKKKLVDEDVVLYCIVLCCIVLYCVFEGFAVYSFPFSNFDMCYKAYLFASSSNSLRHRVESPCITWSKTRKPQK